MATTTTRKTTTTGAQATKPQWRKVDVGLTSATITDANHYDDDNDTTFGDAAADFDDDPNPGIFYSLEVLQGDDYCVTRAESETIRPSLKEKKKSKTEASKVVPDTEQQKDEPTNETRDISSSSTQNPPKKKKRKRKRLKEKKNAKELLSTTTTPTDSTAALALQQQWMRDTHGVPLPLDLCQRLLPFPHPTPIQAAVLAPAILGQSNIVGAAPTGSGKTLAFLIPILQHLWQAHHNAQDLAAAVNNNDDDDETTTNTPHLRLPVQALIITPTRELAQQIYQQAVRLAAHHSWVGCFTGGLALVKQERVLQHQRPALLIGTPGRLWELLQNQQQQQQYDHLQRLQEIHFLVLDEADRMIMTTGSSSQAFPELHKILDVVDRAGTVKRRTFLFSATLTLLGNHNNDTSSSVIMEQTKAKGKIKVVDLSQVHQQQQQQQYDKKKQEPDGKKKPTVFQLPPGLHLQQIQCTQLHKDSHLYAYLMLQQESALVFCNSIAAVRRVGQTMRVLGWSVRILHAHMPQRARFQAVESLNTKNTIVIATDVAARGLDWTAVPTVIHYDAARNMESFVHRAGRTARGIGGGAVGKSLSLIAPSEDKFHGRLVEHLGLVFETVRIDGRVLRESQERVSLASAVSMADDADRQRTRDQQWFIDQARDAGIELDDDGDDNDDLLDDNGGKRGKAHQANVAAARQRLAELLQQPLQIQRHGKFLSSADALKFKLATPVAAAAGETQKKSKRKRRRR